MTRRRARILRVATIVVFALVAVGAVRLVLTARERGPETPQRSAGELGVTQAIAFAGTEPVVVRGYVFDGPGSAPLRLCEGVVPDPPRCLGPWMSLELVDPATFALVDADRDAGSKWQKEPVAVLGTLLGTRMNVQQVMN